MAGRSGDFRKEDPKPFEPLNARTNNPFMVRIEAHAAKVKREQLERREVRQSLWNAAQEQVVDRATRIEDVFAQAVYGASDLINQAITSAEPSSNPRSFCELDIDSNVLSLNDLSGLSLVAHVGRNGVFTLITPENGRIFRTLNAQEGLIDIQSENLHTPDAIQNLLSGYKRKLSPSEKNDPPVAINGTKLVSMSKCFARSQFSELFAPRNSLLYSRHLTPEGWGALVRTGNLLMFNARRNRVAKVDKRHPTSITNAVVSPAEEAIVISDNAFLYKMGMTNGVIAPVSQDRTVDIESRGEHPVDISPDGRFLLTRSRAMVHMRKMDDLSLLWSKQAGGGMFLRDGKVIALYKGEDSGLFDTEHSFQLGDGRKYGIHSKNSNSFGRPLQEIPLTRNMVVAAALDEAMKLLKPAKFDADWRFKGNTFSVTVRWKW